jgi:hypothetical protein
MVGGFLFGIALGLFTSGMLAVYVNQDLERLNHRGFDS